MALTQSQRNSIASYKTRIEGVRKELDRLKENKKRKTEYYANLIKNTKDSNQKRTHRQSKINAMNSFVNQIESKKREIERYKASIKNIKG